MRDYTPVEIVAFLVFLIAFVYFVVGYGFGVNIH